MSTFKPHGTTHASLGLGMAGVGLILTALAAFMMSKPGPVTSLAGAGGNSVVPVRVDFRSPELALTDLSGASRSLDDYHGQVLLVNLWASWCPPCHAEMPALQHFYQRHREDGLIVVGVNHGESQAAVAGFADEHGLTFPLWLDPKYIATDHAFKTRSLPTSFVIDEAGVVRLMWIGAISETNLERYVAALLKE